MTAAEAVRLGPDGFNAWIDAQLYPPSKMRVRMVYLAIAMLMIWKVATR